MNAREAAAAAKKVRDENKRKLREERDARRANNIATAIEEGWANIAAAINKGENQATIDAFWIHSDEKALEEVMAPFREKGYNPRYDSFEAMDFAENRRFMVHNIYLTFP